LVQPGGLTEKKTYSNLLRVGEGGVRGNPTGLFEVFGTRRGEGGRNSGGEVGSRIEFRLESGTMLGRCRVAKPDEARAIDGLRV